MNHYYFCPVCGDTAWAKTNIGYTCQGMVDDVPHHFKMVHLGKGKKARKRQKRLAKGFAIVGAYKIKEKYPFLNELKY